MSSMHRFRIYKKYYNFNFFGNIKYVPFWNNPDSGFNFPVRILLLVFSLFLITFGGGHFQCLEVTGDVVNSPFHYPNFLLYLGDRQLQPLSSNLFKFPPTLSLISFATALMLFSSLPFFSTIHYRHRNKLALESLSHWEYKDIEIERGQAIVKRKVI